MNLYGLIGYPLGHSFSKNYFVNKFEKEGLEDCFFELYPIENIDKFLDLVQSNAALKGLAVTIPYKQSVIPFLHVVSNEAQKIGAVNCIKITDGILYGYNTDVLGFELSFKPLLTITHKKALIFGTGGASKAVVFVLEKLKISYKLVSRNSAAGGNMFAYNDINKAMLSEYTILINCSPVGMSPDENSKPDIPYEFVTSAHYFYDLVYKPEETLFLREGKVRGAMVKNGFEMLIIQAEENWRIWNSSNEQ